jgi:hypothetical protein
MLNGNLSQSVVQLNCLDRCRSGFIHGAHGTEPEMDIVFELVVNLVGSQHNVRVSVEELAKLFLGPFLDGELFDSPDVKPDGRFHLVHRFPLWIAQSSSHYQKRGQKEEQQVEKQNTYA